MIKNLSLLFCTLLVLSSCSSSMHVDLEPAPNSCQVVAAMPNMMTNVGFVYCWDENGKYTGLAATSGYSAAQALLDAGQVGAIVGIGVAVKGLSKLGQAGPPP